MMTFDDLAAWAGADHVTRADPETVAAWRIPEDQKSLLVNVGVPLVETLIEQVVFQREPGPMLQTSSGAVLYHLTESHYGNTRLGPAWSFGIEPDTGTVRYVLPGGDAWFANSSVDSWLRTLHHYGLHLSQSTILSDPENHEEEAALAELRQLAHELKEIDPPAFEGYLGFIWAEFLERWLW